MKSNNKNIRKLVKKLNQKPRIEGVSGVGHWSVLEKRAGTKDFNSNQLCKVDSTYTTPHIEQMRSNLDCHSNKEYLMVTKFLEPTYHEVASITQELELLKSISVTHISNDEEVQRQAAIVSAQSAGNAHRRTEILIRLAEIKVDVETVDTALKHHLERAEDILRTHISSYWKGILKAASDAEMPPYPACAILKEIRGKIVYEEHMNIIYALLNQALNVQEG